jgi:beta-glucosidase-like glycosyl hydrolase
MIPSYGCQNSKVLNGLLKTELGFEGYVMTGTYERKSYPHDAPFY